MDGHWRGQSEPLKMVQLAQMLEGSASPEPYEPSIKLVVDKLILASKINLLDADDMHPNMVQLILIWLDGSTS